MTPAATVSLEALDPNRQHGRRFKEEGPILKAAGVSAAYRDVWSGVKGLVYGPNFLAVSYRDVADFVGCDETTAKRGCLMFEAIGALEILRTTGGSHSAKVLMRRKELPAKFEVPNEFRRTKPPPARPEDLVCACEWCGAAPGSRCHIKGEPERLIDYAHRVRVRRVELPADEALEEITATFGAVDVDAPPLTAVEREWRRIEAELRREYGDTDVDIWFKGARPLQIRRGVLVVEIPGYGIAEYARDNYPMGGLECVVPGELDAAPAPAPASIETEATRLAQEFLDYLGVDRVPKFTEVVYARELLEQLGDKAWTTVGQCMPALVAEMRAKPKLTAHFSLLTWHLRERGVRRRGDPEPTPRPRRQRQRRTAQ